MASTGLNSSVPTANAAPARAEIVLAVASCNHARTIRDAVGATRAGLSRITADEAAVVLVDGGSTDGTRERVADLVQSGQIRELDFERPPAILAEEPYHGFSGRAAALRAVLEEARRLQAKACAIVDAGIDHPNPAHVAQLLAPVCDGAFDHVSAFYTRHRYDGALTKGIVRPAFRALYGSAIRQPLATEFCCSAGLVEHYLQQDLWEAEHAAVGIDLWLQSEAACSGFRLCEAALGMRRPASREQVPDLSTTLAQVVGALFADIDTRADVWQRVRGSTRVPLVGSVSDTEPDAQPPHLERLVEAFRLGYRELRDIWTWVLPAATLVALRKLAEAPSERFCFDDDLWASVIYDCAFGYSQRVMAREHLLRSLTPLYSGWLASFGFAVRDASPSEVENRLEQICRAFERQKRQLIARWRWPERLRR